MIQWIFIAGSVVAIAIILLTWFTSAQLPRRQRMLRMRWVSSVVLFVMGDGLLVALDPRKYWLLDTMLMAIVSFGFIWGMVAMYSAVNPTAWGTKDSPEKQPRKK